MAELGERHGECRRHVARDIVNDRALAPFVIRFLGLVQFTDRRPYRFDPRRWKHKRNVAVRLAEAFAERQRTHSLEDTVLKAQSETREKEIGENEAMKAAEADRERQEWGKMLSLGQSHDYSEP